MYCSRKLRIKRKPCPVTDTLGLFSTPSSRFVGVLISADAARAATACQVRLKMRYHRASACRVQFQLALPRQSSPITKCPSPGLSACRAVVTLPAVGSEKPARKRHPPCLGGREMNRYKIGVFRNDDDRVRKALLPWTRTWRPHGQHVCESDRLLQAGHRGNSRHYGTSALHRPLALAGCEVHSTDGSDQAQCASQANSFLNQN